MNDLSDHFRAMFSPSDKAAADQAAVYWRGVARGSLAAATALAVTSFQSLAIPMALLWWLGDRHADAVNRLAADPPSADYRRRTRPRAVPLRTEAVWEEVARRNALPEGAIGSPAPTPEAGLLDLLEHIAGTIPLLRATVTAVERSQGAELAEAEDSFRERLGEARTYSAAAGNRLVAEGALSSAVSSVDDLVADLPARPRRRPPNDTLAGLLDPSLLGVLFMAGLPRRYADQQLALDEPSISTHELPSVVALALRADASLGERLLVWADMLDLGRNG